MPHVVFPAEPHRSALCHAHHDGGLVPCRVRSVDRERGTVTLRGERYGEEILATYTVDPDERMKW